MASLSDAQRHALTWLQEHNGTGLFDKTGVLIAGGDRAKIMRSTWNRLRDAGLVIIEAKRVALTEAGRSMNARKPHRIPPDGCFAPKALKLKPLLSDEEDQE